MTTTAAADWLIVQGSVGSGTDADYFAFTLSAASGVFFDLDSRDVGLSTTLDTLLALYDSTGAAIPGASNDDGYDFEGFAVPNASSGSATSRDSSLYVDLAAGTYAIRVTSPSNTTGNYNLRPLAASTYSASPPVFHSNAAAAATLYMDFDGHAATDVWGHTRPSPTISTGREPILPAGG